MISYSNICFPLLCFSLLCSAVLLSAIVCYVIYYVLCFAMPHFATIRYALRSLSPICFHMLRHGLLCYTPVPLLPTRTVKHIIEIGNPSANEATLAWPSRPLSQSEPHFRVSIFFLKTKTVQKYEKLRTPCGTYQEVT